MIRRELVTATLFLVLGSGPALLAQETHFTIKALSGESVSLPLTRGKGGAVWFRTRDLHRIGIATKSAGEDALILCNEELCSRVAVDGTLVKRSEAGHLVSHKALEKLGLKVALEGTTMSLESTEKAEAPRKLDVGSLLPNFVLSDLEGKPVPLHTYRGKRLLIVAWASW